MLVQAKYKVNDIVTISLMSGQEALGKLISENSDAIVLSRPLTIAIGPQGARISAIHYYWRCGR